MHKITCSASDCNKKFEPKAPHAKYCSDKCRWRDSKRQKYKERTKKGLCPQCGGELTLTVSMHKNKVTPSYCVSCQRYFKERYRVSKAKE